MVLELVLAGADPGFSEGGVRIRDESRMGGANPSIVSLKQGVWGAQPPRSNGLFAFV